jgi:hypothetical protein
MRKCKICGKRIESYMGMGPHIGMHNRRGETKETFIKSKKHLQIYSGSMFSTPEEIDKDVNLLEVRSKPPRKIKLNRTPEEWREILQRAKHNASLMGNIAITARER